MISLSLKILQNCDSLSSSCRSMLLNQELHEAAVLKLRVRAIPIKGIPIKGSLFLLGDMVAERFPSTTVVL
ncbi:hypothetical protein P8452_55844 [Trifolium repens]|nr:hypothetical protein P8452_55844 [Trifolium repens]